VTLERVRLADEKTSKCTETTEVWSRVCGFYRPTSGWNPGKKSEFDDRKAYKVDRGQAWKTEKKAS